MGPKVLRFRDVRTCVRACVLRRRHSLAGLTSTSSCYTSSWSLFLLSSYLCLYCCVFVLLPFFSANKDYCIYALSESDRLFITTQTTDPAYDTFQVHKRTPIF